MIAQLRLDPQGATKFIKRKCTGSLGADSDVTVETQSAQLTSLSRYKHACRENVALREGFFQGTVLPRTATCMAEQNSK
jgi:hypothetical protein